MSFHPAPSSPCHSCWPLLALLLVLAACDDSTPAAADGPVVPGEGWQTQADSVTIGFGADVALVAPTRQAGDGEHLPDNAALQRNGFGVFCWYTGSTPFASPATADYMLMRNQKVVFAATPLQPQPHWTYSPAKFWPLADGEQLTFRAYAPYTPYLYTAADGSPRLPVIVAPDDYSRGTQHDPLFGTALSGQLYTDVSRPDDGTIHWYFHHGMAKLVFEAMIAPDFMVPGDDYRLSVTRISLSPLYEQGLLDVSASTATSTADKPLWDDRSGAMTAVLGSSDLLDIGLNNDDYQPLLGAGLLAIPRDFSAPAQPLTITVDYETRNPDALKTATATIAQPLYGNTVYYLQLMFNPTTNTVNVILSADMNWQTGSYHQIDL